MAGEYLITDDALRDLANIEDYVAGYADWSAAIELEDAFFALFDRLPAEALQHPVYQFPEAEAFLHEYRSVNLGHYKIFYYVDGDAVVVYRIRHLRSDFTRISWE